MMDERALRWADESTRLALVVGCLPWGILTMSVQTAKGLLAAKYLSDPRFETVPYAARHARLGERLGLDFGDILFTLEHVPLAMNGAAHAAQRADIARFLSERKADVDKAIPQLVARACAVLAKPGKHDLLGEMILPLVHGLIGTIVELPLELEADSLTSRIFSQNIGVAQRRRLQAELAELRAGFAAAFPMEDEMRLGTRLAMIVLGRDALIGTLGQSLHHFLRKAEGGAISASTLMVPPSHTGVPYIDRQASCPVHEHGIAVETGESLRCELASLDGGAMQERLRFFGAGIHLCLGRAMAVDLFKALSEGLGNVVGRAKVLSYALRGDDVFHFPEQFEIEVFHD